jgi:hypothetical protein
MNSTQNKKIEQVKETTMIVGIDVGSEKHYFRAFNWRGIELTRKPVAFSNSMEGFNSFYNSVVELMQKNELKEALVGIEPTGHYWFDLGQFMGEKNIKFVMVNPHHVHKTKELDDNSPSKNDRKDPRVIAGLVRDGRYFYSYMPTGVYAELRRIYLLCHNNTMNRSLRKSSYAFIWKKDVHCKAFLLSMALPKQVLLYGVENLAKNARNKP